MLRAAVSAVGVILAQIAGKAGNTAVVVCVLTGHGAGALTLDLAIRNAATGYGTAGAYSHPTHRQIMARVMAIRAADPATNRCTVAFEVTMILAGMATFRGIVARRVTTITADGAARNSGLGTFQVAVVAVTT